MIGEALTDGRQHPRGHRQPPRRVPANVAYGLARLGVSTGLLTAVGADRRGEAIENHLAGSGVRLLPGSRSLARTSTATATIAGGRLSQLCLRHHLACWPPDLAPAPPKVLHTGSIASFLAPGAAKVKAILQQLRGECTITYDPNIRPALLGTHTEAKRGFEELVYSPTS